jgi:Mannosyltransferase (PIG-V)
VTAVERTGWQMRVPPVVSVWQRLSASWNRLDYAWRLAFWLLVTLRVGFGAIAFLSAEFVTPIYYQAQSYLLVRGPVPWIYLISTWQRWDSRWYQQISQYGYHVGDGSEAFFPLYPLVTRVVSTLAFGHDPGGNVVWAQLVVASVAFFFAVGLAYKLARLDVGPATAQLTVLLLVFFPTSFFLLAPYTESLFLALTLGSFYLARRGHPWAAGIVGFAAGLTRLQGVFLTPALAWEYIRQRRQQGKWPGLALLASGGPALALILFNVYQHAVLGETASPLDIQAQWGYQLVPPWVGVQASWNDFSHSSNLVEVLNLVSLYGFGLLTIWLIKRRLPFMYTLYLVPYLLLLYGRRMYFSPLMSDARFMVVLFPCFLVLATWLIKRPWLAMSWIAVSALFEVGLVECYVRWGFPG